MKKLVLVLMVLALSLLFVSVAIAGDDFEVPSYHEGNCMMLGVGKDASPTGYPIILHNEDDGGRLMVKHGWVPAATWPAGSILPNSTGRAPIPQVPNTFGFWWTQAKGFGAGLQNADGFLNENGVSLMSNSNANSKETEATATLVSGGIEYNLRRVVAERATSARHAVEIIIDMLENYGYQPSGRAYSIGDNKEIWQVQISRGNKYVAFRVPDDHCVIMSNHYTVKHPDEYAPSGPYGAKGADVIYPGLGYTSQNGYPTKPALAPTDPNHLIGYAISMDWYTPAVSGDYSDFQFDLAYQATGTYKSTGNTYRHAFAAKILAGVDPLPVSNDTASHNAWAASRDFKPTYPITGKVTMNQLREAITCHYEDTPFYDGLSLPGNEPHNGGTRKICTGTTIQSVLVQFAENKDLTTLWTAYGRACILPSIPLHPLVTRIPNIVTMADPAAQLAGHLVMDSKHGLYVDTTWQKFREFMYMMEMAYEQNVDEVSAMLEEYFDLAIAANNALLNEAAPYESSVAIFDQTWLDDALNRLQIYINSKPFFGIPVYPASHLDRSNGAQTTLDIIFELPGARVPLDSNLRIRVGANSGQYFNLTNLMDLGGGKWKATATKTYLTGTAVVNNTGDPGEYDFFLGGRTTNNEIFTGVFRILYTDGVAAYNVKFVDWDGTALKTQFVESGKSAAAPQNPVRVGYAFDSWDLDFSNVTGDMTVTAQYVFAVPVTGVSLDKTQIELNPVGTENLTANIAPSNATNRNVSWSSSNPAVATVEAVSQTGALVRAINVGTTTIRVETEDGNFAASCSVNVTPVDVAPTGVTLNKTTTTIEAENTEQLFAFVIPDNATNKSVSWASDNPAVAMVSSSGLVTAVASGTANITATTAVGAHSASCVVNVPPKTPGIGDSLPIDAQTAFGGQAPTGAVFGGDGSLIFDDAGIDLDTILTLLSNSDLDGWLIEAFEFDTSRGWTAAFYPIGTKESIGVTFTERNASGSIRVFVEKGGEMRDFIVDFANGAGRRSGGGGGGCSAFGYLAFALLGAAMLVWRKK